MRIAEVSSSTRRFARQTLSVVDTIRLGKCSRNFPIELTNQWNNFHSNLSLNRKTFHFCRDFSRNVSEIWGNCLIRKSDQFKLELHTQQLVDVWLTIEVGETRGRHDKSQYEWKWQEINAENFYPAFNKLLAQKFPSEQFNFSVSLRGKQKPDNNSQRKFE